MPKAILFAMGVLLLGCDKKGDPAQSKNLFSVWTKVSDSSVNLDLSTGSFGPQQFIYLISANEGCDCTINIQGTQASGTALIDSCTHFGPLSVSCIGSQLDTYSNADATLYVCTPATANPPSTCTAYR